MRPDVSTVLSAEFPACDVGPKNDIAIPQLVLPSGWLGIPGFYHVIPDAATGHHRSFSPASPGRHGNYPPNQFTFADDSMFIGADVGGRLKQNIDWRVKWLERMVGSDSVNQGELELSAIYANRRASVFPSRH